MSSPAASSHALPRGPRLAKRLLILGWDAADRLVLEALFEKGRMPNLRRLIANGVFADLRTLEPKLSPILWSSITTGKTCDKHGILNFVEPKPEADGLRVIQSTTRKVKALWNIFSQTGHRTNVVSWYASHPAEPIQGHVVSNLLKEGEPKSLNEPWPLLPDVVHPAALANAVAEGRQRAHGFPREELRKVLPKVDEIGHGDELGRHLTEVMAYARSLEATAHTTMSAGDWDVTMVFFETIDTAGHHFMQYRPPRMEHVTPRQLRLYGDVIDRVYEWHDAALGRLLERAGPDTTVIILSDHGFHSGANRPNMHGLSPAQREELEASWHRPFGILVAAGPGIVPGSTAGPCSLLDIAPTTLTLLGLPVGEDMDGRTLLEILAPGTERLTIPSWEQVEGDAGMHPPDLRQDPIESTAAIQQLIDLGYLANLPEDTKARVDMVNRSSRFNMGVSLMSRQQYDRAIPVFQALMEESPATSKYGLCLAQCQNAAGAHADAVRTMRLLLDKEPGVHEYRLVLAHALAADGRVDESLVESRDVEANATDRNKFALGLAAVALLQGRYADSATHAMHALQVDPQDTAAHLAAARATLAQGRFETAAGHALDALEITPAIPEAHHLLGVALAWLGEWDDARQSLDLAIQFDPEATHSHRFAALVAEALGDAAAAEDHAAKARAGAASAEKRPFGAADLAVKHSLRTR